MSTSESPAELIFFAAMERDSPEQRARYVEEACAGDAALRARVERLLAAQPKVGSFLESPAVADLADLTDLAAVEDVGDASAPGAAASERPGTAIGPYKLLQQIGEGGFGTVYMAEQEQPVRRRVALKIIKPGMDTKQVIARFEAERQALAMMEHAGIARVFDAGATANGRPYFVMELVRGEPITEFCDKNILSIPRRLELFAQVCHAVQHAHQKGLIHRDLKPSNVMVSMQDDRPVAKVIDFGIAKATQARLTEKTLFTEFKQLIGTPQYMSPEQAGGDLDIDTRSDVYSLGVLLYELLTGTTPFNAKDLRSKAYAEIRRIICEVEPPRPSTRLSHNTDTLAGVAAHRQTEPRKLSASVRGELDWIVMKCLEKDRGRRYESANSLAMDVQRHLNDEPVAAGPPSRVYRLRKFVRRHRAAVIGTALVALLLVGGITGTTIGLLAARKQRDEAQRQKLEAQRANRNTQAVNDFLTDEILGAADPRVTRGRDVSVKEALDTASAKVANMFPDQPLTEAAVRNTLAATYHSAGHDDLGLPHAQTALDIRRRHLGNEHPDTLESINNLGVLLRSLGRSAETEPLWREAVTTGRRTLGPSDPKTLVWTFNLGHLVEDYGNLAEAEQMYRDVLARRRAVLGSDDEQTLLAMNRLGGLLMEQRRFNEADPLLVEALEKRRRTLGSDHPDTLNSINDLALLRQNQKRFEECELLSREALEGYRRVLGDDHPFTLAAMSNMGSLLVRRGRAAEAEPFHREATERSRRSAGASHPRTLIFLMNLGTARARQNKFVEAEADLLEADRGFAAAHGVPPSRRQTIAVELGRLYTAWEQSDPGKGHAAKAAEWKAKLPTTQPTTTATTRSLLPG